MSEMLIKRLRSKFGQAPGALSPANKLTVWLAVGLLLVFLVSRLLGINVFPPFIDEAVHIRYAQAGFQFSPLIYASEGRLFALWWYRLFQQQLMASIWLLRASTLLA